MRMSRQAAIFTAISTIAAIVVAFVPPIPQDLGYHEFADQREILGIPNFWNVVSNLAFLIIGFWGAAQITARKAVGGLPELEGVYMAFFVGITLVGFGSGWYHLNPSNESLFWDRLPMTISFMAFVCMVIGEHISPRLGTRLLVPFVGLGMLSVIYWSYTESIGVGDLRPYGLVQFLPAILIPAIILMYPSAFEDSRYVWIMIAIYLLAKITEALDVQIHGVLSLSGHTLKHLIAAAGGIVLVRALHSRRRPQVAP